MYPNIYVPFDIGLMAAFPNTIMPNPNSISTAIYITAKFRAISLFLLSLTISPCPFFSCLFQVKAWGGGEVEVMLMKFCVSLLKIQA